MAEKSTKELLPANGPDFASNGGGRWLARQAQRSIAEGLMRPKDIIIARVGLHDVVQVFEAKAKEVIMSKAGLSTAGVSFTSSAYDGSGTPSGQVGFVTTGTNGQIISIGDFELSADRDNNGS